MLSRAIIAALAVCLIGACDGGSSREIAGVASVVDGDTLEIHGQRIRLYGIDAPESDQLCTAGGENYRCGQKAALALSDFIGRRTVSCRQQDTDRYGRAVCWVAGQGQRGSRPGLAEIFSRLHPGGRGRRCRS